MTTDDTSTPDSDAEIIPSDELSHTGEDQLTPTGEIEQNNLPEDQIVTEDAPVADAPSASSFNNDSEPQQEEEKVLNDSSPSKSSYRNDLGDTDTIPDEVDATPTQDRSLRDWSNDTSTGAIAGELNRVETEVRELLSARDTRRKRKLAGTRRWLELEEDLLSWRFSAAVDEETIHRLQRLIARRHFLFTRLRFLASTRPTWNS